MVTALADVGTVLGTQVVQHAAQRRDVIAASPELQERGRTKFAAVADALAAQLVRRGSEPASAILLADVGVAIFRAGLRRWSENPGSNDLAACLREVSAELAGVVGTFSPA